MHLGMEESRQPCGFDEGRRLRIGRAFRTAPRPENEIAHDQRRDVIEQKRRDRLIHQPRRPQCTGDERPEAAADETEQRQRGQKDKCRLVAQRERAGGRQPAAHIKLPFGADIDQAHPRRQRCRNGGQHQRHHAHQEFGKSVGVAEDVSERIGIGAQRILAGHDQQCREDGEREPAHQHKTFGARRGAGPQRRAVTLHRVAPSHPPSAGLRFRRGNRPGRIRRRWRHETAPATGR